MRKFLRKMLGGDRSLMVLNSKHISRKDNLMLILDFKVEEVKEEIWDCGKS